MLEDENGVAHGNDWARGFMRGMHVRHDGWAVLVNDEENGGCLIPVMMLCHEHDEDRMQSEIARFIAPSNPLDTAARLEYEMPRGRTA